MDIPQTETTGDEQSWMGLIPGDLVRYNNGIYLFSGVTQEGPMGTGGLDCPMFLNVDRGQQLFVSPNDLEGRMGDGSVVLVRAAREDFLQIGHMGVEQFKEYGSLPAPERPAYLEQFIRKH